MKNKVQNMYKQNKTNKNKITNINKTPPCTNVWEPGGVFLSGELPSIRTVRILSNVTSIAMYRRLGYRCAQRIRGYYPDGEDAWQLEMILRQHSYYAVRAPDIVMTDDNEPATGNTIASMY